MKTYIATRLENHRTHNRVRDALVEVGVELTYDWSLHGPVWMHGEQRIQEVSERETHGVKDADFVIVILPGGRGTHAELGMAIALDKPVFLLCESDDTRKMLGACEETCAFYHHRCCIWVHTVEQLLRLVVQLKEHGSCFVRCTQV
jgi:nucleoside 2-deoxyribosyltransferase